MKMLGYVAVALISAGVGFVIAAIAFISFTITIMDKANKSKGSKGSKSGYSDEGNIEYRGGSDDWNE